MPSTFSTNLGLELQATGENPGTWGSITNTNLQLIEDSIDGQVGVAVVPAGVTVATANAPAASAGRSKVLVCTGTGIGSGGATVTISPNTAEKLYFVQNLTDGPLTFKQGTGSTYVINAGYDAMINCDGTGTGANVTGTLTSLQVDKLLVRTGGSATINGSLTTTGTASFGGNTSVTGNLTVSGSATLSGSATFGAGITVNGGAVAANSGCNVTGALNVSGTGYFTGQLQVSTFLLNIGGDAAYDMHYRGASGPLVRLALGGAGSVLAATGSGPAWQGLIGLSAAGATEGEVLYVSSGAVSRGRLSFTTNASFSQLNFRGPSGSAIVFDCDSGGAHLHDFLINGVYRWRMGMGNTSSGNAHIYFSRFNDSGGALGTSLELCRLNGHILVGNTTVADPGGSMNITTNAANEVPLVIRRTTSQTAHLLDFQNESGAVLSYVDANGVFTSAGGGSTTMLVLNRSNQYAISPMTSDIGRWYFYSANAGNSSSYGGSITFTFGLGTTYGTFYAVLPTSGSSSGLTWKFSTGFAPTMTFEEFERDSMEGWLERLMRFPDLVAALRAILS